MIKVDGCIAYKETFQPKEVIFQLSVLLILDMLVTCSTWLQSIEVNLVGLDILKEKRHLIDIINSNNLAVDGYDLAVLLACRFAIDWASMPQEYQADIQSKLNNCLRTNSGRSGMVRLGLLLSLEKQENLELAALLLQYDDDLVLYLLN